MSRSARTASLTRAVGAAVDEVFKHPRLQAFRKVPKSDGLSTRRYHRKTPAAEFEVSVYRDKWWDTSGGRLYAELYCLVDEVQRLLGGCTQSWLEPDAAKPLIHFQYSMDIGADRPEWRIASIDDVAELHAELERFLVTDGLRWCVQFESRAGVFDYLEAQEAHVLVAELHAALGENERALRAFVVFMAGLPRDVETPLQKMRSAGVIDEQEERFLLRSSLQREDDYVRLLQQWRQQRGL